jgi:transposase-like protein
MATEPKTLQEAIIFFADPNNCLNYLVARRWKDGVVCPTCGSENVSFLASRRLWQCKTRHPKAQFSIKVGTIFEDSAIGLDKWLTAMWMIAACKNGISSYEIHRALGITQKTAWFMLQRIRLAMQDENAAKLSGEVEVDETYIGGKARNMHKGRKARMLQGKGGGAVGKQGVQGMLERGGKVRASVEPFHLFRYVDEQALRYNHRKDMNDGDRMNALALRVAGKRLTFAEVTGKVGEKPEVN